MASKVDVRIVKTKDRLKNALLNILQDKRLDEVTISEICTKAAVNRNTFYSHYQSIKDLLDEIEAEFLEVVLSKIHVDSESTKGVTSLLTKIFEVVQENKEMCRLLFTDNGDKNFIRTIVMFAMPAAVKNWQDELNIPEEKATKLYYFTIGGAVYVIEQWIKDDFVETPEELANILNQLILNGQSAFES